MANFDIVIRGGTIYDGTGDLPYRGDIGIIGDMIAGMGVPGELRGKKTIDADGLAVAPGFINMLSWANESLIVDGRSQSNIRQGVTLEVLGEGESMGPLNESMKKGYRGILTNTDINLDIEWTTLAQYLEYLEKRGVSPNVASFVGAGTLRIHEMGHEDRPATAEEMDAMKRLLVHEMEAGAMGMSAALIYPPETYISTDELIDLCRVVKDYDGLYISHIRNEGSAIHAALDEFFQINEVTGVRAEVYHLKIAGQRNWHQLDSVIERLQEKRTEGYAVSADMYPYNASGTGLSSCIPPWAHEGGHDAMMQRLHDRETRLKIRAEMLQPSDEWENMFADNAPRNILLAGFKQDHLREQYQGKTLADVAAETGQPAVDALLDLILADDSRIFTIYFSMDEDNIRKKIQLPFVSFCSDAGSFAPEPPFLSRHTHPRAYGSFARVLGRYCRDENLLSLEEAVRRMSALPAENLKIDHERGLLQSGYFADIAIFDAATIKDNATFAEPHQYATGMQHVFVNGIQVLRYGDHTGATPGHFVRGPGYHGGY